MDLAQAKARIAELERELADLKGEVAPGEEWRPILGLEGRFEVSNLGRVRALEHQRTATDGRTYRMRPRIVSLQKHPLGYKRAHLRRFGDPTRQILVHRLVAEAFLPNPGKLPVVNHKDHNPANNRVENLEWMDQADNIRYARDHDRIRGKYGGGILVEAFGRRRTLRNWCRELGVNYHTARFRIRKGMAAELALTTAPLKRGRPKGSTKANRVVDQNKVNATPCA